MTIHCPACRHAMTLNSPRPGTFTPRCTACREKFTLTIPEGENPTPKVRPLPAATALPAPPPTRPPATATRPPEIADRSAAHANGNAAAANGSREEANESRRDSFASCEESHASRKESNASREESNASREESNASREESNASREESNASRGESPASRTIPDVGPAAGAGPDAAPHALGGYQIVRKLGQGGMGSVYLARQVSLDRPVAVKVLSPKLSADAGFVARFTREAYAAAQLVHHHVVQVYDIGEDAGRHYYSMEYVEGESLAAVVARDGRLDPADAVAYTLQAARGLKFAHDRGLVHRDVKPDNLLVSKEGMVKVADLGLVKHRGKRDAITHDSKLGRAQSADVTGFNYSMGTPAYMAPEQAKDAASVDGRADIYSLGCTLYDLLTGHPPFAGKTAMEVLTKHAREPATPPDVVSRRVPKEASAILMRMIAKAPDDRYASIDDCIAAMEEFLGVSSHGPFVPKEEHAAALEASNKAFRDAPLAQAARYTGLGFFAVCGVVAAFAALLGGTLAGRVVGVGGAIGLAVLTFVAYVVVAGVMRRDITLGRLRPLLLDVKTGDAVRGLFALALFGMLLWVFGLTMTWIVIAVVAAAVAVLYHFGLQRPRDAKRKENVEATHEMLRTMRLRGLEEETLRGFVCRYSGRHWEEFYEALFGYDAKLDARKKWGLGLRGKSRPKFGVWRDALIAWATKRVARRKAAREQAVLAKAEAAKLKAEGVDPAAARKAAEKDAAAIVKKAEAEARRLTAAARESAARQAATAAPAPAPTAAPQPAAVPAAPPPPEPLVEREHHGYLRRRHGGPFGLIFGPSVRFPVAAALVLTFLLWFHQSHPDFASDVGGRAKASFDAGYDAASGNRPSAAAGAAVDTRVLANAPTVLRVPVLPYDVRQQLSGYRIGIAGGLLLLSCVVPGALCGLLALAGAAVIVLGDRVLPGAGGYAASAVSTAAGAGLVVAGLVIGRR